MVEKIPLLLQSYVYVGFLECMLDNTTTSLFPMFAFNVAIFDAVTCCALFNQWTGLKCLTSKLMIWSTNQLQVPMFVLPVPNSPFILSQIWGFSMTDDQGSTTVRLKKLASSVLELSCMLLGRFCQASVFWIAEMGGTTWDRIPWDRSFEDVFFEAILLKKLNSPCVSGWFVDTIH